VSSSYGGNLFVAFGCDETELQCYDDAFMLDTTYPQGHYWQKLPVGMQRPAARQMLTAWVHGASLVVSGGCTPAQDAAQDHCYSDVWQLPLDGLIQGGKQLNATVHVVEEDAGLNLNLQLLPGQRSAAQATAALSGTPAAGGQSSRSSSGGGGGGASELASNATTSAISGNATASGGGAIVTGNHTVTLHNGTEGRIVGADRGANPGDRLGDGRGLLPDHRGLGDVQNDAGDKHRASNPTGSRGGGIHQTHRAGFRAVDRRGDGAGRG
jgi:hypothetical protein